MRVSAAEFRKLQSGGGCSPRRQQTGYENREAGGSFEKFINTACDYYWQRRIAHIKKTPDEMKVICPELKDGKRTGRYLTYFEKPSQPDYKGTLHGGLSVSFEAKHTTTEKIDQDRVTRDQWEALDADREMGAVCFVVIGFSMKYFYRIPWQVWKDMYRIYGRKNLKPKDIDQFRLTLNPNGILLFLDKLEVPNVNTNHH